jgi:dynactin-6
MTLDSSAPFMCFSRQYQSIKTRTYDPEEMSSRPAGATKRVSTATPADLAPKPPCTIHTSAVVSEKAQITGSHPVEIGENTVIHPYAKIRSDRGSVKIGRNCTVCEKAVVGIADGEGTVVIGDGVNIETGALVEAAIIGDGTSIEVRAIVGRASVLGKVQI